MKKLIFLFTILNTITFFAQTPQGFNYSAVARDASGKALANRNIAVQMSILKGSAGGTLQYSENHLVNTDGYGLFNLVVGTGNVITGNLTTILWGSANHYLKVAIDANGGNSFVTMGTTQLMSVPYAMYSQNGLQNGTTTGEIMYWNGVSWTSLAPGSQSQTLTLCDGTPTWTTDGQCPGTIAALNCDNPINNGTLVSGTSANGVNSSVSYTGGGGGNYNGQSVASTGVTGLLATLSPGSLVNGSGILTYNITGTPNGIGTASFAITIAGKSCTLLRTVIAPIGTIASLNCAGANNPGTLTSATPVNGLLVTVPYTGGNGGNYNGQTVTSTGVTGLTAVLSAGTFANGSGNLTYTISGTPNTSGNANFALNIGGQSCSISIVVTSLAVQYPSGSVFCNGNPTAIVDVYSPTTGKTWMDRNLGAVRVATSSTDASAYGDLYQWGRGADGHQCRGSITTSTLSSTEQPGHSNFITNYSADYDWLTPQNNNLWQGINGVNNPCPLGYRVPSSSELDGESSFWNTSDEAFNSPLKLTVAGYRSEGGGRVEVGTQANYWTSTVQATYSFSLIYWSSGPSVNNFFLNSSNHSNGISVRCIKD